MTTNNNLTMTTIHRIPLAKCLLAGASIGLLVILVFILPVENPHPDWPKYWMIRPLLVTPFAGAMGGLFFYLADKWRWQGGWKKVLANVASLLVFLFGLWMGIVLGLDGTLWN